MSDRATWDDDTAKIGILLSNRCPDLYPLAADLNDLKRYVAELPEFEGDCRTVSTDKLEAIPTQ